MKRISDSLMKKDAFGWSYKFDLTPYIKFEQEIINISNKVDTELDCFGAGFMLAFFYLSIEEIKMFQNDYSYFPYDAYLDHWESWMKRFGTERRVNYNQRNKVLSTLVNSGMISKNGDTYLPINNPFEKLVNRMNNLEELLDNG